MKIECEFCGEPAVDEIKRRGRIEAACEQCLIDVQTNDEIERREDAYERAVDQSISEWKDGGKVGFPRPVGLSSSIPRRYR